MSGRRLHIRDSRLASKGARAGGPRPGSSAVLTTVLQVLVEAAGGYMPVVIVDPKDSPALEATVRVHGGQVWTLDGRLPADQLDPPAW
jgi:hypothetical protein